MKAMNINDKRRDDMPAEMNFNKINGFLRIKKTGQLSKDRVARMIKDIASAAVIHPDQNILLDSRDTNVSDVSMFDILKTAMEIGNFKDILKNKIADLIPDDEERISIAKKSEAAIQCKGIQYKFFTGFEEAIEWLSDTS